MTLVILLLCATSAVYAIDQTATGFYYPTGTSNIGSYSGWLLAYPEYPYYNKYHIGADIDADAPDPVYAIADGEVIGISSGPTSGWGDGNVGLFIKHQLADGSWFVALYGHVRTTLSVTNQVSGGDQIATIGPLSTEHLHFGIHPGASMPSDPYGMLPLPVTSPYNGWVDPINWITTYGPDPIYEIALATEAENWGQFVDGEHATEATMIPGGSWVHFKVRYKNLCNFTWSKNQADPNWVGLMSCRSDGSTVCHSFLNDPWNSSLGWMTDVDHAHVTNFNEASVPPGVIATFEFDGYIPEGTDPVSDTSIYFSLHHATHGFISDGWGGLSFQVTVANASGYDMFLADMDDDGKLDLVGWNTETGDVYIAKRHASNKTFVPIQNPGIEEFCRTDAYTRFVADVDNDGYPDLVGHKWSVGRWYVAYNQHDYTFDYGGSASLYNFCGTADYKPFVADINHDGYPDFGGHLWTNGKWFVAFNQHDGTFDNAGFLLNGFCGAETYKPFVADVDGDGYLDFCGHKYTDGKWFYASNQHDSTFDYGGSTSLAGFCGSIDYITNISDWDGDGAGDFWGYKTTTDGIYIAYNYGDGRSFTYPGNPGISGFGDADYSRRLVVGDVSGDGKLDAIYSSPTDGSVIVAKHNTTTLSILDGDGTNDTWLTGWCVESGGSPKVSEPPHEDVLPSIFTLNQNYPNPFNPMTVISYSLPTASDVKLDVFNILGQKVTTLVNGRQEAGEHTITWDASQFSSGVYFYRIQTADAVETKKMLLLK